jgi:hypothetical protein
MRLSSRPPFEENLKKWSTCLARSARHSSLETRTARARLPVRRTPYFAKIAKGLRLGYYRGAVSGSWVASFYRGGQGYDTKAIGQADDTTDADGATVFDYWQAQALKLGTGPSGSALSRPASFVPALTRLRMPSRTISPRSLPRRNRRPFRAPNTSSMLGSCLISDLSKSTN